MADLDAFCLRETFLDSDTGLVSVFWVAESPFAMLLFFFFFFDLRLRQHIIKHSSAVHMVRMGSFAGSLRFVIGMSRLSRPVN